MLIRIILLLQRIPVIDNYAYIDNLFLQGVPVMDNYASIYNIHTTWGLLSCITMLIQIILLLQGIPVKDNYECTDNIIPTGNSCDG
jgi:hypothetical protein